MRSVEKEGKILLPYDLHKIKYIYRPCTSNRFILFLHTSTFFSLLNADAYSYHWKHDLLIERDNPRGIS